MAVEEGVDVGAKKEAVVDIEAFSIGFAFRPGFGVAGAKDFGYIYAGKGAAASPVVDKGLAIDVLADSLADEGFALSAFYVWFGIECILDFFLVSRDRCFGHAARKLGSSTQKGGQEL